MFGYAFFKPLRHISDNCGNPKEPHLHIQEVMSELMSVGWCEMSRGALQHLPTHRVGSAREGMGCGHSADLCIIFILSSLVNFNEAFVLMALG